MNPQEIRTLLDRLKDASTEPEKVADLCDKYLSESTPSHRLSVMGATIDSYKLIRSLKDRETGMPIIEQLADGLTALLHQRGYRNNIDTHQEHRLYGSSGSGDNPNGNEFPHTVGAILSGKITVEEARKARELENIRSAMIEYWGIKEHNELGDYRMLLPPIDDFGKTVRDPFLIDRKGNIIAERLVEGAPFRR